MSTEDEDILLGRLLAGRDEPTVIEREALWQRIEPSLVTPKPERSWSWIFGSLGLAATAAAIFLMISPPQTEFGVRGGEKASFVATCVGDSGPESCHPGRNLVLKISAPKAAPYIGAFIERPDGVVLWLSPGADELTTIHEASLATRLEDAHPTGRSNIVLIFSPSPASRRDLKQAVSEQSPQGFSVLERQIEVRP